MVRGGKPFIQDRVYGTWVPANGIVDFHNPSQNADYRAAAQAAIDGSSSASGSEDTGLRLPDFYTLNISIAIPNPYTGTIIGWNGTASIDRHGQIFVSPFGVTVGKSATIGSASLTANYMLQSKVPTADETYGFLSGHGISAGAGYWGGVNFSNSPANSGTNYALGFGLYTPQAGVSYNYTTDNFIFR
jgi:hypothetical protein